MRVARPDRDRAARRGAAAKRRLPRAEPQRPVLERAPRSARVRAPAVFRASGGHPELVGEAGVAVRRAGRGARRARQARRGARRTPCRDPCRAAARRRRQLPRGARADDASRARRRALPRAIVVRGVVRARTRGWPTHSRLFAVGERIGWSVDEDARHLEATARGSATTSRPASWARFGRTVGLPHEPLRSAAAALARLDAPARHRLPARPTRNGGLSGVRHAFETSARPRIGSRGSR